MNRIQNSSVQSRESHASQNTRSELTAILNAVHQLEAGLASPAYGKEAMWRHRAQRHLSQLLQLLEEHIASVQNEEGLFQEIRATRNTMAKRINLLLNKLNNMKEKLEELIAAIVHSANDQSYTIQNIRDQTAQITHLFRQIQAEEAELILEALYTDIGVGD